MNTPRESLRPFAGCTTVLLVCLLLSGGAGVGAEGPAGPDPAGAGLQPDNSLEGRFQQAVAVFRTSQQPNAIPMFARLIDELRAQQNRTAESTRTLVLSRLYRAQIYENLGQTAQRDADLKTICDDAPRFRPDDQEIRRRLGNDISPQLLGRLTNCKSTDDGGIRRLQRRVTFGINRGYTVNPQTSESSFGFAVYRENGTTNTTYRVDRGFNQTDFGAAVRIVGALALGFNHSTLETTTVSDINSRIPHPTLLNAPRTLVASVPGLKREERVVHMEVRATKGGPRSEVAAFFGPSFFDVQQSIVSNVVFRELTSSVAFISADRREVTRDSIVGFNAGADVAAMIIPYVGFGAFVRYSYAKPAFTDGRDTGTLVVGGFQTGLGLRLRW